MFEVPEAKRYNSDAILNRSVLICPRVKRSDLIDQDADERSILSEYGSPEAQQEGGESKQERKSLSYGFEYDFITPPAPPTAPPKEDQDKSYEFRLFATTAKPTSDVSTSAPLKGEAKPAPIGPRITLVRSPSPTSATATEQEGRFLRPRHESHYLATASPTRLAQYKASAISLSTLSTLSHTPWPGTSLPWRVTHLPSSRLSKSLRHHHHHQPRPQPSTVATASTCRSKPNKKRRILLRQRLAALQPKSKPKPPQSKPKPVTRTPTGEIELPPEEREKRTARNREKKLKRRQREREKKAAGTAAPGSRDGDDDDNGDGD